MKPDSNATRERIRKLLVIAQLMTLVYFALGLAFTFVPTPLILFLFASLSPMLAAAAVFILVKQWIATGRQVTARVARSRESYDQLPLVL